MRDWMLRLARGMAMLGGTVLSFLILLTCLSVAGRLMNGWFHGDLIQGLAPGLSEFMLRTVGVGPIDGDFEIVEAGVAFAIFAFFPLCQITAGHATVDILAARIPPRAARWLQAAIDAVFAAVLILIAAQLLSGALSKRGYGETSLLLQYPVWWGFAACFAGAACASLAAVHVAVIRMIEAATGRAILSEGPESER